MSLDRIIIVSKNILDYRRLKDMNYIPNILVIIIASVLLVAILVSLGYLLYYRLSAQKSLDKERTRRTNLPSPLNFIFTCLIVASFIGNVISIIGFITLKDQEQEQFYSQSSIGEIGSEFQYIKDQVITNLRPEYEVLSHQSNEFIMYYARINEIIKDSNTFLPNYIVYIAYVGETELINNYHIKFTTQNGLNKASYIVKYESDYSIMILNSHEIIDVEISGEIKQFVADPNEDDIRAMFDQTEEISYSFSFKLKNSIFVT